MCFSPPLMPLPPVYSRDSLPPLPGPRNPFAPRSQDYVTLKPPLTVDDFCHYHPPLPQIDYMQAAKENMNAMSGGGTYSFYHRPAEFKRTTWEPEIFAASSTGRTANKSHFLLENIKIESPKPVEFKFPKVETEFSLFKKRDSYEDLADSWIKNIKIELPKPVEFKFPKVETEFPSLKWRNSPGFDREGVVRFADGDTVKIYHKGNELPTFGYQPKGMKHSTYKSLLKYMNSDADSDE